MKHGDLVSRSCLCENSNNFNFILTVRDIFISYAWAILLMKKSVIPITDGFKTILLESRTPEKL